MSSHVRIPAVETAPETALDAKPVGAHPRIVALAALGALVAAFGFAGRGVYYAATDAWMAPINLSPDTDAVIQINVKLNEQIVARDKLRADIERIDADMGAIELASGHLRTIREDGEAAIKWSANSTGAQSAALGDRTRSLATQHALLTDMLARQMLVTDRDRKNVSGGLSSTAELDHDLQTIDELKVALSGNERDRTDTSMQLSQLTMASKALRDAAVQKPNAQAAVNGLLPELAAGQERGFRVSIELVKLEAEKRSLVAQRGIAVDSLARMDEVFKQLKSRPLYRAVQASTDVAFVPYTQLAGVQPGNDLVSCKWVIFECAVVGRIAEVLPGEVVAQDPWAEVARGQYVILDLTDHEASKEKVIRSRKKK